MIPLKCIAQLLHAPPHGPFWLESRQSSADLAAVHAIASRVGTSTLCVANLAAGDDLFDHLAQLAHAIVLLGPADIERLVVNYLAGRMKDGYECARDILDVDEGAPRAAVALDQSFASCKRYGHQIVHDNVCPQTGRQPVCGGV